jgi:hypothetical protein
MLMPVHMNLFFLKAGTEKLLFLKCGVRTELDFFKRTYAVTREVKKVRTLVARSTEFDM